MNDQLGESRLTCVGYKIRYHCCASARLHDARVSFLNERKWPSPALNDLKVNSFSTLHSKFVFSHCIVFSRRRSLVQNWNLLLCIMHRWQRWRRSRCWLGNYSNKCFRVWLRCSVARTLSQCIVFSFLLVVSFTSAHYCLLKDVLYPLKFMADARLCTQQMCVTPLRSQLISQLLALATRKKWAASVRSLPLRNPLPALERVTKRQLSCLLVVFCHGLKSREPGSGPARCRHHDV